MMVCGDRPKLSYFALAFAFGITNGLWMFLFALGGLYFGYGMDLIHMISSMYPHFGASLMGGLWGFLWGFLDGFFFGLVLGFIYNMCLCCCHKKKEV